MTTQTNYPIIRPTLDLDFANSQELDPRITFTRSSPAVYYDGNTSVMADQNLLTNSNGFTIAGSWILYNATTTANSITAPDGTTTGSTLTDNATNGQHRTGNGTGGSLTGTLTASAYFLQGTATYGQLGIYNGSSYVTVTANLSTGVITETFGTGTSTIVSAGGGWYRLTITITGGSTNSTVSCSITNTGTPGGLPSYVGTGQTIYIWGGQLEQRSSVTAYTPTTTAITNYIPVLLSAANNTPRFDHNPNTGQSLGLLVEQQSTNLLTYSDQFNNAVWVATRATINSNVIIAPDGTLTGDKIYEDTSTNTHVVSQSVTLANATYTASAYLKAGERTFASFQMSDLTTGGAIIFVNLSTGVIVSSTATGSWSAASSTITSVGNGWYKVTTTGTKGAGTIVAVQILPASSGSIVNYTGDGYSGIYIWGAQLEATAFPTSYIPTVATTMTRIIDSAVMTGTNFSSWFNQGQYTMYAEGYSSCPSPNASSMALFCVNGAITQNSSNLGHVGTSPVSNFYNSGVLQGNFTGTGTWNLATNNKIALAINTNDSSGAINGVVASSITSNLMPSGLNYLYIGSYSAQTFNGTIKRILCYPARLTNTQIQALTTI